MKIDEYIEKTILFEISPVIKKAALYGSLYYLVKYLRNKHAAKKISKKNK